LLHILRIGAESGLLDSVEDSVERLKLREFGAEI